MTEPRPDLMVKTDERPLLISLLGGGWFLMGCFGAIHAILLLMGGVDGFQFGSAHDSQAQLASAYPEFVDAETLAWMEIKAERLAFTRLVAWPLLLFAGLSAIGGLRLLRRESWTRTLLLVAGFGEISRSLYVAHRMQEFSTRASQDVAVPTEFGTMVVATLLIVVAVQSLPIVLGMSLLRHPTVRRYVHGAT